MDGQNGLGLLRYLLFYAAGVQVVSPRVDVAKDRDSVLVDNAGRRGEK